MARINRDSNVPHHARTTTPPTREKPTPQLHSRLPRRLVTPTSATPTSRFASSSVAERIANAERAASESRSPLDTKHVTASRRVGVKHSTPAGASDNKTLLHEKPLPSRPIARLTNMPSPSKDGRSLADATDRPLHVDTPDGERREWPALTPSSARSMSVSSIMDPRNPEPGTSSPTRPVVSPSPVTSPVLPAEDITGITSTEEPATRRRSLSETSSYTTALDRLPAVASASIVAMPASTAAVKAGHNRGISLTRHSLQNIGSYQQSDKYYHAVSSNDMPARAVSMRGRFRSGSLVTPSHSNKVLALPDFTRIPSAPRASSRPTSRASSREPSPSPANFSRPRHGSASSSVRSRSIKTASRIPITDTKKATIVNVKQDRGSGSSKTQSSEIPRFGSRRLANPEALKVLESGKVRRQMQLEQAEHDADHAPLQRRATNASDASTLPTPSLSYSFDTSPEGTTAPGSPEGFIREGTAHASSSRVNLSQPAKRDTGVKMSTGDLRGMFAAESATRAPPSKSPFSAPLPTIQSQAILPTDPAGFQDAGEEDLIRTLSHLEGKGSPPTTEVDQATLRSMFGHLKRSERGDRPDTTPLHQNAAAAERFLALEDSGSKETETTAADAKGHIVEQIAAPSQGTVGSKWSMSTPSDKPEDGVLLPGSGPAVAAGSDAARHSISADEILSSIGWPSLVPKGVVPSANDEDAAAAASADSRRSSPTLGTKRDKGSVRAARVGLRANTPSYARTTTATQSRKTSKLPAPSSKVELMDRGRAISSSMAASNTGRSKAPRSRSKSRIVLDKINGFFSGNREKKEDVPPVPKIDESFLPSRVRARPSITHLGPPPAMPAMPKRPAPPVPPRPSQIPKMPSLSPFLHTSPRAASPSTTFADDATLVDRVTLKDESQQSVKALGDHLLNKAKAENNLVRKQRFLTLAKVLNDSMMSVRQAGISAETALTASNDARMHYEMTMKGLKLIQRMATNIAKSSEAGRL